MSELQEKGLFIKKIRDFFHERKITEVYTSVLDHGIEPNLFIEPYFLENKPLPTSPEFGLKKCLSKYQEDIFTISHAFRKEEQGSLHKPEFLMLEYYRQEKNHMELANEVVLLINHLLNKKLPVNIVSQNDIFKNNLNIDIQNDSLEKLYEVSKSLDLESTKDMNLNKEQMIDYIFSHKIQPNLKDINIIHDFLPSQASLSKVINDKSKRFEILVDGCEIANGFLEESNKDILLKRFTHSNHVRQKQNLPIVPIDNDFLKSMDKLPNCSGVAIGLERLYMIKKSLSNVSKARLIF